VVTAAIPSRKLLSDFLRDEASLTGVRVSCEHEVCGACTILVDGWTARACLMLAAQADSSKVRTVESLARDGQLHPLQEAFRQHHGLQCGYCTPGMIMAALGLIQSGAGMSDQEVRLGLEGNLCRCTGYQNIVTAIQDAAGKMQAAPAGVQGGSE